MSVQERLQITLPRPKVTDNGEGWASVESVHTNKGNTQPEESNKFNRMPLDVIDDGRSEFVQGFGGNTDVSGMDINPASLNDGFSKRPMGPAQELYTGEMIDLFYDDAGGFAERNNYLDRI